MERIVAPVKMAAAWKRLKFNRGAAGLDGMYICAFPAWAKEHWPPIRTMLLKGRDPRNGYLRGADLARGVGHVRGAEDEKCPLLHV